MPSARADAMRNLHHIRHPQRQHGLSMIELLVGLTIGLLTISVAIGTLVISRQVSGTVNDASQLQQQAAQAFRSIGQQAHLLGSKVEFDEEAGTLVIKGLPTQLLDQLKRSK